MKERYVLAIYAASGFLITAGISFWRSREPATVQLVTHPPAPVAVVAAAPRSALPPVQASPAPSPPRAAPPPLPGARPQLDYHTDPSDWRQEQQARRLARRAAQRGGQ